MKCESCGHETDSLLVNTFDLFGADFWDEIMIEEHEESAVLVETSRNWTGYELSEEEMTESIRCPYCKKWPFKSKELQLYEPVHIVMFKSEKEVNTNGEQQNSECGAAAGTGAAGAEERFRDAQQSA